MSLTISSDDSCVVVSIGSCDVKYSEIVEWVIKKPNVKIVCPSVELLITYYDCQMTLKHRYNAKLNGKKITITEPEDHTQVQVTYNDDGDISKVKVTSPGSECYISKLIPKVHDTSPYTHNLYRRKYSLFSTPLSKKLADKLVKNKIFNQHGLQ